MSKMLWTRLWQTPVRSSLRIIFSTRWSMPLDFVKLLSVCMLYCYCCNMTLLFRFCKKKLVVLKDISDQSTHWHLIPMVGGKYFPSSGYASISVFLCKSAQWFKPCRFMAIYAILSLKDVIKFYESISWIFYGFK